MNTTATNSLIDMFIAGSDIMSENSTPPQLSHTIANSLDGSILGSADSSVFQISNLDFNFASFDLDGHNGNANVLEAINTTPSYSLWPVTQSHMSRSKEYWNRHPTSSHSSQRAQPALPQFGDDIYQAGMVPHVRDTDFEHSESRSASSAATRPEDVSIEDRVDHSVPRPSGSTHCHNESTANYLKMGTCIDAMCQIWSLHDPGPTPRVVGLLS